MAAREFSAAVTVKCSPEHAFDYFADHRHVAAVVDGVTKWEPIGSKTEGVGARYEVEMVALGFPLKSVLRLDRWRRPHEIGWVSEKGLIKQEGGFTFTKVSGGVHIVLRIAYTPPGAILGAAVAGSVDGVVRGRLQKALERIRGVLETS
jgi:Polyketide cyclase / dehydrase and lipid transport